MITQTQTEGTFKTTKNKELTPIATFVNDTKKYQLCKKDDNYKLFVKQKNNKYKESTEMPGAVIDYIAKSKTSELKFKFKKQNEDGTLSDMIVPESQLTKEMKQVLLNNLIAAWQNNIAENRAFFINKIIQSLNQAETQAPVEAEKQQENG